MAELIPDHIFVDTGESSRVKENFQNYLFHDYDFRLRKEPIDFFRSDFRAVKMQNMYFSKNNFERADFINCYISKTGFEECFFGADFGNTVVINSTFKDNIEDTCSYYNCHYYNCTFEGGKVINSTNRNTKYKDCVFEGCEFEMNSFVNIAYDACSFSNINIAEMGAYDLKFDNCSFNEFIVDPDYLGSYLIKNSSIKGIKYLYRGDSLTLNGNIIDDLRTLSLFYLQNNRYYESFNTYLLYRFYTTKSIDVVQFFQKILTQVSSEANYLNKIEQLEKIINILIYYSDTTVLSTEEHFHLIGLLENLNIDFQGLEDRLKYYNNISLLKSTFENHIFALDNGKYISPENLVYYEIEINEEDYDIFKIEFEHYFKQTISDYIGKHDEPGYKIIGTRKGSLIVEVLSYAIGAYVLISIIKSTFYKAIEIKIEYDIFRKTQKHIGNLTSDDIKEFKESVKDIREVAEKPSSELITNAERVSKLIKQINIFPNALFKKRDES